MHRLHERYLTALLNQTSRRGGNHRGVGHALATIMLHESPGGYQQDYAGVVVACTQCSRSRQHLEELGQRVGKSLGEGSVRCAG